MKTDFINVQTSEKETVKVDMTQSADGKFFIGRYEFGTRFFNKYGHIFTLVEVRDGKSILRLRDGWTLESKKRTRKSSANANTEPEPANAEPAQSEPANVEEAALETWKNAKKTTGDVILVHPKDANYLLTFLEDVDKLYLNEIVKQTCYTRGGTIAAYIFKHDLADAMTLCMDKDIPVQIVDEDEEPTQSEPVNVYAEPEPVNIEPEPEPMLKTDGMTDALALAFAPVFNKVARDIETKIRNDVRAEIDALKRAAHTHVTRLEVTSPQGINTVSGIFCDKFETLVKVVQAGKPVYMYGPAGCGKSYTAKQVADALGLPYFETSQAMFAHDLKGYGDAGGNYVETPLYKAFTQGGLFFLDEVDASRPEAVVVLNNLIANKRFDFPVVGLVEAHPNFRVMAAGNTRMTGHTTQYVARQGQDASFKNRFFFSLFTYDERIERALCENDEETLEFVHDLRDAVRETGIQQLVSYRQITDMHSLAGILDDDAYLLRGSVFQEKEADEVRMMYEELAHKNNRWAKATKALIEILENEKVW